MSLDLKLVTKHSFVVDYSPRIRFRILEFERFWIYLNIWNEHVSFFFLKTLARLTLKCSNFYDTVINAHAVWHHIINYLKMRNKNSQLALPETEICYIFPCFDYKSWSSGFASYQITQTGFVMSRNHDYVK